MNQYRITLSLGDLEIRHVATHDTRLLPPEAAYEAVSCLRSGALCAAEQGRLVDPSRYGLPGPPMRPMDALDLVVEVSCNVLTLDVASVASYRTRTDGGVPRCGGDGCDSLPGYRVRSGGVSMDSNLRIELSCCTQTLLREIAEPLCKRNDVALTYALAIQSSEATDWKAVNEAIVARWSKSALQYIKRRAWEWVEKARAAEVPK